MNKGPESNIVSIRGLISPDELIAKQPVGARAHAFVKQSRAQIQGILEGSDRRFLLVMGPCSIHDPEAGLDYARRLRGLMDEIKDDVLIVMRTYFEKPRTRLGWKGLIMDPYLDGTYEVNDGLEIAREFLLRVIEMEIPTATEFLDPFTPQYIGDLISWAAIGARTVESQTHRLMASGLPMPTGFKNSTEGAILPAVHALKAATQPQTFLGINGKGEACAIMTEGNPYSHLILRGGKQGPNYDAESVHIAQQLLQENHVPGAILIDCAHGNSGKDAQKQKEILREVVRLYGEEKMGVCGAMLESNINGDNQVFPQMKEELRYGTSITDPCLSWEETENILLEIFARREAAVK